MPNGRSPGRPRRLIDPSLLIAASGVLFGLSCEGMTGTGGVSSDDLRCGAKSRRQCPKDAGTTDASPAPATDAGPSPSMDAPATGSTWPGSSNTGVPAGTQLTPYTGPCTILTPGTTIDSKIVNCRLVVQAGDVLIKNSKINGGVWLDSDLAGSGAWSYILQDSEVDGGQEQMPAVAYGNLTVLRCNIYGGQTSVQCSETSRTCIVRDSWLHGQYIPPDGNWHLGGYLSNGGSNVELTHNLVVCDSPPSSIGEGCTGDINLIPNFAVVSSVTIQDNLLGANTGAAYCTYGGDRLDTPYPHADHVVYRNNVFQRGTNDKCAAYGPVTNFNSSGVGNEWTNNLWDDGTPVPPEN